MCTMDPTDSMCPHGSHKAFCDCDLNMMCRHCPWFHDLSKCVVKWSGWGLDTAWINQLVSLACVFNGKAVAQRLLSMPKSKLPLQMRSLVQNERACSAWLQSLVKDDGSNVFSTRSRVWLFNSSDPDLGKELLRVLSREEAACLAELPTISEKPFFADRKPGWSVDPDQGFLGKNQIMVLHHLGRQHTVMKRHVLQHCVDHPRSGCARFLQSGVHGPRCLGESCGSVGSSRDLVRRPAHEVQAGSH